MHKQLTVASLSMAAGPALTANAASIANAIDDAAAAGARLLAVPECALCGYPGASRDDLRDLDLCALADHEDLLHQRAAKAGIALFLGTVGRHPQPGADRSLLANEILACGAIDTIVRYRKRCLTPTDERHFHPGTEPVIATVDGWRIGISICFDVRFPALWSAMAQAGCDAFLCCAHMAGRDTDPGTKATVIPALYAARATEWVSPLLLANTSANDRWLDSGNWDARGCQVAHCSEGLMLSHWQHREQLAGWYSDLHRRALAQAVPPSAQQ